MKAFPKGTLSAALLGLFAVSAPAVTIYVPRDQPTIQQAINAATNGDIVLISAGTYFEHIDFHGKSISVQSSDGAAKTIIDGTNTGIVVNFHSGEGAQSVLRGFTIQHGGTTTLADGGGISLLSSSPTITQNIFRDNNPGGGGLAAGIGGNISSPVIERNAFLANTCDSQSISGVVAFFNASSPRIINNIFLNNPCRAINITLPTGNHPVVANNTIIHNNGGILVRSGVPISTHLYANNIVVGNSIGLEVMFLSPGLEPTWINNLVFDNVINFFGIADQTGVNGNISADPMFLPTRSRDDFELQAESPAIDAGTLSVPGLPSIDFIGNPRVVDGDGNGSILPDIGAYEFIPLGSGFDGQLDLIGATDEVTSEIRFTPE